MLEFERRLSAYLGAPAVACSSGQSALMIMLRAAGIDSGEVIVPAYTFSATPHAVRWCGATPVFADISRDGSLCLDPAKIEALITERTVAILGVDVYGIACDYAALERIARRHRLRILYDSAPAFGSRVDDRPIGAFGDAQIFSFHATKAFATMEGGCIASNDADLVRRARAIRNFGQSAGSDCDEPGLNAKMMEVCALIGLEQLGDFDRIVRHRAQMAGLLKRGLGTIPGLSFAKVPANQLPVWLYFPIIIDAAAYGLDRDELALALEAESIFVRKYFGVPCHRLSAYAEGPHAPLPESERVASSVLSLPIYNDMTRSECESIISAIASLQEHAREVQHALSRPATPRRVGIALEGGGTRTTREARSR